MATDPPVTQQIGRSPLEKQKSIAALQISDTDDCFVYNEHGNRIPFRGLYQDKKAIVIFVRHFLCYTCKEYVEDLAKIPKSFLTEADVRLIVIGQSSHRHIEAFCSLTRYPHEIYVDPEKHIYKKLGMKREETFMQSGAQSPHVKSSMLSGSVKSMWRAITSPVFDFQGDPQQQGGSFILGPGSEVHFAHFDMNRLDQMPINWLLQLAGVQTVDFSDQSPIIHV
ncbi:peroxiredoxin-like 2C [Amia ocellicauda]|uniref:peroxiredoxin-like 2C n=1 Tax=Amia ocellicauda TaxID=2972642 RepID=UPI00346448F7|nr:AAED1 protein [Amia calva]